MKCGATATYRTKAAERKEARMYIQRACSMQAPERPAPEHTPPDRAAGAIKVCATYAHAHKRDRAAHDGTASGGTGLTWRKARRRRSRQDHRPIRTHPGTC